MAQEVPIAVRRGTVAAWRAANPVCDSGEPILETDTHKARFGDGVTAYNSLGFPIVPRFNDVDGDPRKMKLSKDSERFFFVDDFSNNTIGQYTLTGAPTISGGELVLAASEKAVKTLNTTSTTGKWTAITKFTTTLAASQYIYLHFGSGNNYVGLKRLTGNVIEMFMYLNDALVISSTAPGGAPTLADDTYCRISMTYDGATYTIFYNDASVATYSSSTPATNPTIGGSTSGTAAKYDKWDYIPSVTFTDPFTADTEARYHQLQNPAGAGADDIVVGGGVMTIAGTGGNEYSLYAVLKSYNFGSGEYEIAFKNNGDGGGGADTICVFFGHLDVQNTYRLTVNDNGTGSAVDLRLYYLFNNYSTQIGSTKDIRGRYVRGNKTWVKIQWDAIAGRFWIYLRDDAGVYPTTPDISDAFSTLFSAGKFGFGQIISTAGAGNLNVSFYPPTVRAHCLIGETNVPTTETGYYFRDEYTTNSIGRYTTTGTWAVSGGVLSCSGAGNCKMPFGTDIGVHTFTPTFANGTDYYYFGGYRLKFVASGGNTCVITLETAAGVAQGSGSLTVTTTAGAFVNPVIINQAATSITVMCSGATGAIISGTTVVTAGVPYFSVGTATCTFDNYSFSGSRAYNKPMLRGAQIGEYWNGTQSVYCTRFVDDHCWDTSAEYTVPSGSLAADTANGRFSLTSGALGYVEYYPTGLLFSTNTLISCDFWLNNMDLIDIVFPVGGYSFYIEIDSAKIRLMSTSGGQIVSYVATVSTTRFHSLTIDAGTTGTIKVYWNGLLIINSSSNTSTIAQTYPKISCYGSVGDIAYIRNLRITGIESSSKNGVNLTLGGVPHGARYDTQESATFSFTNQVKYGKYFLIAAAKTTNASAEDAEFYFRNLTDTSNISLDATNTLDISLSATTPTDFTKELLLDADDRGDTITLQARRKTAATDNSAAVFVEYASILPSMEVGSA